MVPSTSHGAASRPRLVIIGAGIAGLAAARAATNRARGNGSGLEVVLLEASTRAGGKLLTWTTPAGTSLEWGPDSFLAAKPRGIGLVRDLGLEADLISPGPLGRSAYLLLKGQLRRLPPGMAMGVPTGIRPLFVAVRDGIIGPLGALRASIEPLLPSRGGEDPSAAEVARYRLGSQVADRLVAPLVGGVFGVPYDEVSLRSALPMLAEHRSWILTMARRPTAAKRTGDDPPPPIFQTVRGGMTRIVEAILAGLPPDTLRTGATVTRIEHAPAGAGFHVHLIDGEPLAADAILVAAPSHAAGPMLEKVAPQTSQALAAISYHASAVALLRYDPAVLGRDLDASGFLVAPEEHRTIAASSWLNAKWPQQDYDGVWIRAIVTDHTLLDMPDDTLLARITAEMNQTMRASRGPEEAHLTRWPDALPIYAPGHAVRVATALAGLPEGIALAGAAYRGFGIPDCIATGEEAAERLLARLASSP